MTTQLTELQKQAVHYADIRKRLFYSKPKTAPVKMVTYIEPQKTECVEPLPIWMTENISFDYHVASSRDILRMINNGEISVGSSYKKTIINIVNETLERFPDITVEMVKSDSRSKHIVAARHQCMYNVRVQRWDLSYPAIGRWFGNRDHSAVFNAYYKIAGKNGDKALAKKYRRKLDRSNAYHQKPCIPAQS